MAGQGFDPAAVIETSPGNFQAWLRHALPFPKALGTLAAKLLVAQFGAYTSAADWRRFGRAPGFTTESRSIAMRSDDFLTLAWRSNQAASSPPLMCSGLEFSRLKAKQNESLQNSA